MEEDVSWGGWSGGIWKKGIAGRGSSRNKDPSVCGTRKRRVHVQCPAVGAEAEVKTWAFPGV